MIGKFLLIVSTLSFIIYSSCGSDPNLDKTTYLMTKKIGLNKAQAEKFEAIINDVKKIREIDRVTYQGNDRALLQAAREREKLEIQRLESVLSEGQVEKFRVLWAEKKVSDRAMLLGEKLGLNRKVTIRIDSIIDKAGVSDGCGKLKNQGDHKVDGDLKLKSEKLHKEIEQYLNEEQKTKFRKIVKEECGM